MGRANSFPLRLHQPLILKKEKDFRGGCVIFLVGVKWEEKRGTAYEEGTYFCVLLFVFAVGGL